MIIDSLLSFFLVVFSLMHVFPCSCTRAILLYLQPTVISQLFCATLTYGGRGGLSQCYIIRGSDNSTSEFRRSEL